MVVVSSDDIESSENWKHKVMMAVDKVLWKCDGGCMWKEAEHMYMLYGERRNLGHRC